MRIFSSSNIKHVIIPWESQPPQKAICLAAHDAGIKVWGYCHAAINGSYVHLINNNWKWCPDVMLINGYGYMPIMEKMGWKNKLEVVRSLRYPKPPQKESFEGKAFLPYDIEDSIAVLNELKSMVNNENFTLKEIRCHPDNVNHKKIKALMNAIPKEPGATNIYVGGFSSVLFEALQAGCSVFNIQVDPLYSENAYKEFNNLRITRLGDKLTRFEPIADMTDYFFCFDEEKYLKIDMHHN
jgi:hypothetical protein